MTPSPMDSAIRRLRGAVSFNKLASETDRQLLQQFIDHRDEDTFGVLVRWHGQMVMGVCLRVACYRQNAEDVFQATFLV
jgi:hypothetical protein